MQEIKILDCTLRDGGYCNDWVFGRRNIDKIIDALFGAGVDMVEYGYLDGSCRPNIHATRFPVLPMIPDTKKPKALVMINYGEIDIDTVPQHACGIWGIRVAFHKKDKKEALTFCRNLKAKGYCIFIQPMVTCSYSEEEFCELVREVNGILPSAFYVVDSFGAMQDDDVKKYIELADELADGRIALGFHGHDNSRMAFLNAVTAINTCKGHSIYIDSTIMGMGRGAGNLGTENIIEYCNRHWQSGYDIQPILKVIDEVIVHLYAEKPWGYTLPFYLAARYNCHPSYARYLDDRKTLTVTGLNEVFGKIAEKKKVSFQKEYIEKIYYEYMSKEAFDCRNEDLWEKQIEGRDILLLAPGRSIAEEADKLIEYVKREDPIVISVNFEFEKITSDYIFISNQRRYSEWVEEKRNNSSKLIITSNVPAETYYLKVRYSSLLAAEECISDNAGLMAIRLLMKYHVKSIVLAGFDGYQYDERLNYMDSKMQMETIEDRKKRMNECIKHEIGCMSEAIELKSLTPSMYMDESIMGAEDKNERNFI